MNSGVNMETAPLESLQLEALDQRRQLHETASELRQKVYGIRERLRITQQARGHLLGFCIGATVAGAALGYGVAGAFTRNS
jgi:hypothetical protein